MLAEYNALQKQAEWSNVAASSKIGPGMLLNEKRGLRELSY